MTNSDMTGNRQSYRRRGGRYWFLFIVAVLLALSPSKRGAQAQDPVQLSQSDLSTDEQVLYIPDTWKFKPGDNLDWKDPHFDDSEWQRVSTRLGAAELPFIEWEGVGWFRLHLKVDSSLVNYPLAILAEMHRGASEIYFDGQLLYSLGQVSIFEDDFIPYRDFKPRPIRFPDTTAHLLAVRYANHNTSVFNNNGMDAGFRFLLGDLEHHIGQTLKEAQSTPMLQMFYAGGLLAFTIIHFLLFLFYPSEKRNLYFALFTGFLAILTFTFMGAQSTSSPVQAIAYNRYHLITGLLTVIYALRFTYSLFYEKTPAQFWGFLGVGLFMAGYTWFNIHALDFYREIFVMITIVEILRVLMVSFYRKKRGVWIVGTGLACFGGGIFYTALANLEVITANPVAGNIYGSVLLILSMSIYLSRSFARTQKRLEQKLIEVKHLSKRSLEQERVNKEKELERKLLEAENTRKTRELEEARTLQLSMLPKKVPDNDYWDISVFMETAQEVGGDYYDFTLSKDGTMTVALGDATGHGMKAGIMVATAKSYFHTLANEHDNIGILRRMSSGIRNMDLKKMYMSFLLMKCERNNISLTSAGMPPVLHYRSNEGRVEQLLLKGMPLGSRVDYPYDELEVEVEEGDTLLLMSDGLMELFNSDREMLGLERIERSFRESAGSSASDTLSQITKLIEQWAGSNSNEDDITLVVMKARKK